MLGKFSAGDKFSLYKGTKRYELSNHLGNVLAVVSDKKVQTDGVVWSAAVVSAQDYYPFGMAMPGRSSGSYRYGFNGKETDAETGLNDFGARLYDGRLGRWLAVDPQASKYTAWSSYHFGFCNPAVTIDPNGEENIIIVAAQYDKGAANKLMFMHHALRQLKDYKEKEPRENTTILLMDHQYTEKQKQAFTEAAAALGATVVLVKTAEEVVSYINSKTTDCPDLSDARLSDKVTNIDVFSHGTPGNIDLAYGCDGVDKAAKLSDSNARNLKTEAFEREKEGKSSAVFTSYACRTGAGKDLLRYNPTNSDKASDMEHSLAQLIAEYAQITVKAYTCRTAIVRAFLLRLKKYLILF